MKKILFVSMILVIFMTGLCFAEQIKIGIVDMQRALNESKEGQEAKREMAKKADEYKRDLQKLQDELDKMKADMEKQGAFLSEEARQEKERLFQRKLKDFQNQYREAQEELQQKDAEYTRKIVQKLEKILRDIGTAEKFTIILEKSASGVFYFDKSIDITDKLLKRAESGDKK